MTHEIGIIGNGNAYMDGLPYPIDYLVLGDFIEARVAQAEIGIT